MNNSKSFNQFLSLSLSYPYLFFFFFFPSDSQFLPLNPQFDPKSLDLLLARMIHHLSSAQLRADSSSLR